MPAFHRKIALFILQAAIVVSLLPPPFVMAQDSGEDHRHSNRLAHEKSPYLLQHAHNPVDWFPWGKEAFLKARKENKLIFLSIGYSTCHWCHVMEQESFEDEEVAAVLARSFVAVKVDREERPDVDQVYMDVCNMLTGRGGWPLTIIMTPDRLPFFAGTYIPREPLFGRIGIIELLDRASSLWREEPEKLLTSGRTIVEELKKQRQAPGGDKGITGSVFLRAEDALRSSFDERYGGFGTAPKFPRPHSLIFLIQRYRRSGDQELLGMSERTLRAMRLGGIYDHLGFGFHRYSTDRKWFLPHFEKMLYDQAGIALAYLEAFQATGKPGYGRTAREIFTYVLRDMTGAGGAFYSAEDADSEGVEGKFYLWTADEIAGILGAKEGGAFGRIYGITEKGNFTPEEKGVKTDRNILYLERPVRDWSTQMGASPDKLEEEVEAGRANLFRAREKRSRPFRDDKIITSWNGLMISAFARGAQILGEPEYGEVARKAADFILSSMRSEDGRLLRRYRQGEAAIPAFAEDYAFMARGLLDLYNVTYDPEQLKRALELSNELVRLFWEDERGLFDTATDAEMLMVRPRKLYDGAVPSANSMALEVMARLFLLTGDVKWSRLAGEMMEGFGGQIDRYPAGYTHLLQGAALLLEPTREVVISGEYGSPDTQKMFQVLRESYAPETSVIFRPARASHIISTLAPYTSWMEPYRGKAAAYVCQNFTCDEPLSDPEKLRHILSRAPLPDDTTAPKWFKGAPPTDKGAPPTDKGAPPTDKGAPPTDKGAPPENRDAPEAEKESPEEMSSGISR